MTGSTMPEYDVVVFGSGAAGMAAAAVAASQGLSVAMFEKAERLGGTTATSGGVVWIPDSRHARNAHAPDSRDQAKTFLQSQIGENIRNELVDAYLSSCDEAIGYLEKHTELKFDYVRVPDYVSDAPGASPTGRSLSPRPFNGALLGDQFERVLPPRRAFMVLGGLMVGRKEIPMLLRPWSSFAAICSVASLLGHYAVDRMRYSRGTRLLMGNALIARLLFSNTRMGVAVHTRHRLECLCVENGRVCGAQVARPGGTVHVRARKAVVMATGGFPHSAPLREKLAPHHLHRHSLASAGNVGDAIRACEDIGADVDKDMVSPGFWTPASVAPDPHGADIVFPYGHLDRGKPGAIIVDQHGRRFVNEADSYHHVVLAMFAHGAVAPHGHAFIVCDERFIRRYGLGLVKPYPFPRRRHIKSGYLKSDGTIPGLARQLGIDPAALQAEIGKHNEYAAAGRDPDFRKGETAFNRYNGDDQGQPNPCLIALDKPPYHAIEIVPATLGTAVGLRTDEYARVLKSDGSVIEGLYACGNDMGSVMRGSYPGPGITIGPALVFAYRAMRHAALGDVQLDTAA